ncbi:transcriptional regulator [Dietzia sp. NCCP-2495]|uniref:AraC family transcriptional regulator n=1 Tax=Dietzia sp. NCCP-2495 TaxID=2934675 RepID=UPI002231D6F2|nr:AraC family transcriptional regulator [Dietzia sp. NCCP-2495]GLB63838.1 transcriptional regulator [Dietzia sp. NCCP-2495]
MTPSAQKFDEKRTAGKCGPAPDPAPRSGATARTVCTRGLSASEGREQWREALESTFCEMDVKWPRRDTGFSADLSSSDIDVLHLSRVRADPHRVTRSPAMVGTDQRDDLLLLLAVGGELTVSQRDRSVTLSDGSFSMVDAAAPFIVEGRTEFDQIVLHMPRALLAARLPDDTLVSSLGVGQCGATGLGGMLSRFLVDLSQTNDNLSDGALATTASTVLDLLATTVGERVPTHNPTARGHRRDLLRVQHEMIRTLHLPGRGLAEISADLGMSVRYVHKLFEITEFTPRGFLTEERLKRARWLLVDSDRSVAEVGALVGYRDVSHFSRAFSSRFGTSPSRFRASPHSPNR